MNKKNVIIALFLLLLISCIVILFTISKNNYPEFEYEYLGEVTIDSNVNFPLEEFEAIYYYSHNGEIFYKEIATKPVCLVISDNEDEIFFKKIYKTDFEFTTDYKEFILIVTCGSQIVESKVDGIYEDEISSYKPEKYNVILYYNELFDGNRLYFYKVARNIWSFEN